MSPIAATRPAATMMLTPVMVRRRLTDGSSITRSAISRSRTANPRPAGRVRANAARWRLAHRPAVPVVRANSDPAGRTGRHAGMAG